MSLSCRYDCGMPFRDTPAQDHRFEEVLRPGKFLISVLAGEDGFLREVVDPAVGEVTDFLLKHRYL